MSTEKIDELVFYNCSTNKIFLVCIDEYFTRFKILLGLAFL